jgi:hypothetical protein
MPMRQADEYIEKYTLLHAAMLGRQCDTVIFLIERGADRNINYVKRNSKEILQSLSFFNLLMNFPADERERIEAAVMQRIQVEEETQRTLIQSEQCKMFGLFPDLPYPAQAENAANL